MQTEYRYYNHPDPKKNALSSSNMGPSLFGFWHVVISMPDHRESDNPTDPFINQKILKAIKLKADFIVIKCDNKQDGKFIMNRCPEESTPYTILIDPRGEVVDENT